MKNPKLLKNRRILLTLMPMAVAVVAAGCISMDDAGKSDDKISSKPWDSPEGWQNGALPGMMQQPH